MKKKIIKLIKNKCTFLFEDNIYNKVLGYVVTGDVNSARLIVEEQRELMEIQFNAEEGAFTGESRLKHCRELEDLLTEEYINKFNYI